jgi:hypothetical protein
MLAIRPQTRCAQVVREIFGMGTWQGVTRIDAPPQHTIHRIGSASSAEVCELSARRKSLQTVAAEVHQPMHPVFVGLAAPSELLGGVTTGVGGSDGVKPAVVGIGRCILLRHLLSDLSQQKKKCQPVMF